MQVRDGNVEKALRKFKKKMNNSKILQDFKARQEYVKPSTRRKLAKNAAKKRWQKKLTQQLMPPKQY